MSIATEIAARREGDEPEDAHRLHDILVEEVSLVDRPANKRRFLVVKRSDDMADDEDTKADDRGGTAAQGDVEKAKKPMDDDKDEDAKKARQRAGGKDADAKEAAKATAPKDDDEDEDEAEKASDDEEEDEDEDDEKKKARKAEPLALPEPMKEALLRALTYALQRLMVVAGRVKDARGARKSEDVALPDDVGAEVRAVAGILDGIAGQSASPTSKAAVTKAGARMSKDRLDRFQKAMVALADILKELTDSKDAPAGPTAGAAESGVKKRDADGAPAAVPGLAELVTGIGDLTRVVKRQEEELGRIRQARGVSNAIPVDGARRKEPADVSWPMDMNRPISRDKVKKEVSFFDEE